MNTTLEEATALAASIVQGVRSLSGVEVVLCPPFISLAAAKAATKGSPVEVGAQNMYFEEKGAFTGETSPMMLKDLCAYVILGHSERRSLFRETDDAVGRKVAVAVANGLKPILCVGETAHERQSQRAEGVVTAQIRDGLSRIKPDGTLVIAYEPVWAIGSGLPATPQTANEMCGFIRREVAQRFSQEVARDARVLYGGSVTSKNIGEFMSQSDIDGALVGGASLQAEEFIGIARVTAGG